MKVHELINELLKFKADEEVVLLNVDDDSEFSTKSILEVSREVAVKKHDDSEVFQAVCISYSGF